MVHILAGAGAKVIQHDHLVSFGEQTFAQVTADKSGPTGNQYFFSHLCVGFTAILRKNCSTQEIVNSEAE